MRTFLLVSGLLLIMSACEQRTDFTIEGELKNAREGWISLDEIELESVKEVDSVQITSDGTFTFSGEITVPKIFLLRESQQNFLTLIVEPGEHVKIEAWYDTLESPLNLRGSEGTQLLLDYNEALKDHISQLAELNKIYQDSVESENILSIMDDLDRRSKTILESLRNYTLAYIDENTESLVSLMALYQQVTPSVYVLDPMEDLEYYELVDSVLYGLYPGSAPVQAYHNQFEQLAAQVGQMQLQEEMLSPGQIPPEIALPAPSGDTVRLSSTRGEVVLLDFWAAWCAPCRSENPNLVSAYNKYSPKGFEIYQVSLDQERDDWLNAIEKDGLGEWIHVSDLQYWNSTVVPQYRIEAIPYNLLLDKEGRIIASNLRGKALHDKLEEVLGN